MKLNPTVKEKIMAFMKFRLFAEKYLPLGQYRSQNRLLVLCNFILMYTVCKRSVNSAEELKGLKKKTSLQNQHFGFFFFTVFTAFCLITNQAWLCYRHLFVLCLPFFSISLRSYCKCQLLRTRRN